MAPRRAKRHAGRAVRVLPTLGIIGSPATMRQRSCSTSAALSITDRYDVRSPDGRDHAVKPLFPEPASRSGSFADAPLATRMRPRTLDEFVGQEHLVGPGRAL